MSSVIAVTDSTFKQEVLESQLPVLVDFWATWCGPCKLVAVIVDQVAAQYQEQLKVVKLDAAENPRTANEYNIRNLPTLMIFKQGELVDTVVGAVGKQTLDQTLSKHI